MAILLNLVKKKNRTTNQCALAAIHSVDALNGQILASLSFVQTD